MGRQASLEHASPAIVAETGISATSMIASRAQPRTSPSEAGFPGVADIND